MSEIVLLTLKIGITATIIAFTLGTIFAYFLYNRRGFIKNILETLIILPLVLPPTIIGYILLKIFNTNSGLGGFLHNIGIEVIFNPIGAVIAAFIVALPLVYMNAKSGFQSVDKRYSEIAKTLGQSRKQIFFKVLIPLSLPALLSALVLAFARSMGEFGATLMVAGNIEGKTQTISTAIYDAVEIGDDRTAIILISIMIIISFVGLLSLNTFVGRKGRR